MRPDSLIENVGVQEQVEFVGYIVKTIGVSMNDRKVKSVQNWAHPRCAKEVQIFIEFPNFYRRFMKISQGFANQSLDIKREPKGVSLGKRAGGGI